MVTFCYCRYIDANEKTFIANLKVHFNKKSINKYEIIDQMDYATIL